jgi:uncharacterized protein GlcG (DUF336 family)
MLTRELAGTILAAAEERADTLNVKVNVAVLDAGGHLKAFVRMDGAILGSIDVAIGKARTAVLLQMTSEAVWELCEPGGPAPGLERSNGGLVTFAGGIPLRSFDNKVIGAVGVSGGTVGEDLTIAQAALAASDQIAARNGVRLINSQEGAI